MIFALLARFFSFAICHFILDFSSTLQHFGVLQAEKQATADQRVYLTL